MKTDRDGFPLWPGSGVPKAENVKLLEFGVEFQSQGYVVFFSVTDVKAMSSRAVSHGSRFVAVAGSRLVGSRGREELPEGLLERGSYRSEKRRVGICFQVLSYAAGTEGYGILGVHFVAPNRGGSKEQKAERHRGHWADDLPLIQSEGLDTATDNSLRHLH